MIRNFLIFVAAIVLLTLLAVEAATAAPLQPPVHRHDAFCAKIGAGVSPDPDLPGNQYNIVRLHTLGCDEWYGTWTKSYTTGVNARCNTIAYEYAKHGHSLYFVIEHTSRRGCVVAEDGTWLAAS